MPLTLITGPANAAKAGAALTRFRAALPRDPLLVVPTPADVDHYRRELAASGLVFGGDVVTFARLVRIIAERVGLRGRRLGPVARDRVVRAAIRDVALERLAPSAASPGFPAATAALFAELQRELVTPARLVGAVRRWAAAGGGDRAAFAAEAAALYAAYRRRMEALGAFDADGHAWAALDALRQDPAAWGARPAFLYGFDDLTRGQIDAVETLSHHAGADVVVTLPYEPGRAAFAGRATTVETLKPLAEAHESLPDRSEHYAGGARPALHHLERSLFEPDPVPRPPNGAVRLLEAGGERAEAELVGAAVLELMREGVDAREIAVLVRGGPDAAGVIEAVLAGYGIPVDPPRRRQPLGRTRLGAGMLAAARTATGQGDAADVLTWLRTPGCLDDPGAADALEARLLRTEQTTVAAARRAWERMRDDRHDRDPFHRLDALAAAAAEGPLQLLRALVAESGAVWTAPHRGLAKVLDAAEAADARVASELHAAVEQLQGLAAADPALLASSADAVEALSALEVWTGGEGDGVVVADPLATRARRFRAAFVCGLQDGDFPRRGTPDPFLSDADRRALAMASGLALPMREDTAARERYLFYAAVSRPEEVLFLSWRSSGEEGDPLQPSPFIADVRALFTEDLWDERGRRLLADVTWSPREAPTPGELRRALAGARAEPDPPPLGAPRSDAVRGLLASRGAEPARGLETFAGCGVRWLVEHVLRPNQVEPDPEPLRRGSLVHEVLERTLTILRERTGSARLAAGRQPDALDALSAAMAEVRATGGGARARAGLRALEADLRRLLSQECERGAGYEPRWLEWSFGGDGDAHGALDLGEGVLVTGRVDRIDVDGSGKAALVRDYKGRSVTRGARWAEEGRVQAALYALAARQHLGVEPVGALYQPVGAADGRPRGVVLAGVAGEYVESDLMDADGFAEALQDARGTAVRAAHDLRAGRISACPERCSPRGCMYPGICRASEPALHNGEGDAT